MIRLQSVTRIHSDQTLFEQQSLHVRAGERIGIVGPNGAGKSTLFRLITGEEEPNSGSVIINRVARLGCLAQEFDAGSVDGAAADLAPGQAARTALTETQAVSRQVAQLEERQRELELQLEQSTPGPERERLLAAYGLVQEQSQHVTTFIDEHRALEILNGLGFRDEDLERPLDELSGGHLMRVALARLLVDPPDVLMLDEPTNHLDLQAVLWLRQYLRTFAGTLLLISHDRALLNALVGAVIEVEGRRLMRYQGNYDEYVEAKALRLEHQHARKKNVDRRRQQIEGFVTRFRYKATKARQVQSRIKELNKLEEVELDSGPARIKFRFPSPSRGGKEVLALEDLGKSYGDRRVYAGINLTLFRGMRVALVGRNGAGKSTLLKIMAGALDFEEGKRRQGHDITLAHYAQHRREMFDLSNTVLQEALRCSTPEQGEEFVRTFLGVFLFSGDDAHKKVAVLSGGEKSRLALAQIMLDPPNLLLLDEPTTHLDVYAREALEAALDQYTGTICLISHDETFIAHVANSIIEVGDQRLNVYPGSYDDYLQKKKQNALASEAAGQNLPPGSGAKSGQGMKPKASVARSGGDSLASEPSADKRALSSQAASGSSLKPAERRKLRAQLGELERRIEVAEQAAGQAAERLADPVIYADRQAAQKFQDQLRQQKSEAERLLAEWEDLAQQLEEPGEPSAI